MTGHNNNVRALVELQNGDLASGSWDNSIKIWNSSTGLLKRTLIGHTSWVSSLAVLQNGHLASGSADRTIKIWDRSNGV